MNPSESKDRDDPLALLPLAPRDFLLLLALSDGPGHGYRLIEACENLGAGRVKMDPANLYRSLKRLDRKGLVVDAGRKPTRGAGGERRRYFEITPFGRAVVTAEAERLDALADLARQRQLIGEGSKP